MDSNRLIEILRATIDPNQRENAEKELEQVHKIIGFTPSLLQVVMMGTVDLPVRQAGVIYLKNMVQQFWADKETEPGKPIPFHIHEQDRAMVRDAIVDAIVYAADLVRIQLAVCVSNIVKHDFPSRWTGIVDKLSVYLQMNDQNIVMGALLCLYQLVKNFEYKNAEERAPLHEAMVLLLPLVHARCLQAQSEVAPSEAASLLQKQSLKILFALVQYHLSLQLITREVFAQWMQLIRNILITPIPEALVHDLDEEEQSELSCWKAKKWCLHIVTRVFERYGSPDNVTAEYADFAQHYLATYTGGVLEVLLKWLDHHRLKNFVAPRVVQLSLHYLDECVSHSLSWKLLKPHMLLIIQEIIFPLMCTTDQDEELWTSDPHEYIRLKFDIFEDFVSPVSAAQTLLHSLSKKRRGMLQKSLEFVMGVLTDPGTTVRAKDGALHMVGTVADVLLKRKHYKEQMESVLVTYVFPHFTSEHGFMRARACWVLHYLCAMKFSDESNLVRALDLTRACLLGERDLPVQVEAAVCLQALLQHQARVERHLEPHVEAVVLELLRLLRETSNDDLTSVMQKILCTYTPQLVPIAHQMTQHLAQTFLEVISGSSGDGEGSDEKTITAMGILNTLDTVLSVMEEHRDIIRHLEPLVLNVVGCVLTQSIADFYEEAMSLVYSLSSKAISPDMWKVFELMYKMFEKDGVEYFVDMMPALHNFVRVDTQAFVSNENHLLAIFNMCKGVLTNRDCGEDAECHAAKLLEIVILTCRGMIDPCIPSFVEVVLCRLTRDVETSELRTMCLQVVIAALYYNPALLLSTLEKIQIPNTSDSITAHFIQQWLLDTDCFLGLHDRKVCVVGLCTLIASPLFRSTISHDLMLKIVPALLMLFEGLKRAYAYKAQEEEEDDSDEDEDYEQDDVLGSDEDELDEESAQYLESLSSRLQKKTGLAVTTATGEAEEEEEYEEEGEETALEGYTTPLDEDDHSTDEYALFKECMSSLQAGDPAWYGALTSHLSPEQRKTFQEVLVLAEQRRAAAASKEIEKRGGYIFENKTVPTSFNFGGTPLS